MPTKIEWCDEGAKLAECTVIKIRNVWYKEKPTYRDLSRRFGVSPSQIANIIKRRAWNHV
jgi:hypothetical protein